MQLVTSSESLLSLIFGLAFKICKSAAFLIKFRPSLQNFKTIRLLFGLVFKISESFVVIFPRAQLACGLV